MPNKIILPESARDWDGYVSDLLESESISRHKSMTKRACGIIVQRVQVTPENIGSIAKAVHGYCGATVVEITKAINAMA